MAATGEGPPPVPLGSSHYPSVLFEPPLLLYGPHHKNQDFGCPPDYKSPPQRASPNQELQDKCCDHAADFHDERQHLEGLRAPLSLDDDDATGERVPMYSKPIMSASAVSKDGMLAALVVGDLLLVYKVDPDGQWNKELSLKLPTMGDGGGARFLGLTFLRGGGEVAIGGTQGEVLIVQRSTGKVTSTLRHTPKSPREEDNSKEHASFYAVHSVKASPKETLLATCGGNGEVILWDLLSKVKVGVAKHNQVGNPSQWKVHGQQGALLRPETRALLSYEAPAIRSVQDCDFHPDEGWLVTVGENITVDLWDITSIKPREDRRDKPPVVLSSPDHRLEGHVTWVQSVAFSPSGHTLASLDVKGYMIIWYFHSVPPSRYRTIKAHELVGSSLTYLPRDNCTLVTTGLVDHGIKFWQLQSEALSTSADIQILQEDYPDHANASIMSHPEQPDPILALYGHSSGLRRVSCLNRVPKRGGSLGPLQVLSSGIDQRLLMWTIPKGVSRLAALPVHAYIPGQQASESQIRLAYFSSGGTRLATCRHRDLRVHVWDMEGREVGKLRSVLKGLKRPVTAIGFASTDEDVIAAGDEEGHVCLWRLGHDDSEWEDEVSIAITKANLPWYNKGEGGLAPTKKRALWEATHSWSNHECEVRSVHFDEHDLFLATCDAISQIFLLDVVTADVLHVIRGFDSLLGPVRLITLSSVGTDGSVGAQSTWDDTVGAMTMTTGRYLISHTDREVQVWQAHTGMVYARKVLATQMGEVILAFDARRQGESLYVCACLKGGRVVVWTLALGGSSSGSVADHEILVEEESQGNIEDLPLSDWTQFLSTTSGSLSSSSKGRAVEEEGGGGPTPSLDPPPSFDRAAFDGNVDRVIAWGDEGVAVWMRRPTPEVPPPDALEHDSSSLIGGQDDSTCLTGLSESYHLVMAPVVGGGFHGGAVLAGSTGPDHDKAVRVVRRDGWVIDYRVAHEAVR